MIPVLETERLTLRGHTLDDFAACAALWADPDVVKFIGGQPSTAEQAWARLLRYVGHWQLLGYGFWIVVERATGRFAGEVGIADFKRDADPPIPGREAGWVLASWAQGKGFATEAVRAMLAWNDATFANAPVTCVIDPPNAASIQVAKKCGFVDAGHTTYQGTSLVVLRRAP